jgi:two-component system heavy metal sensor histidine kinase CusS
MKLFRANPRNSIARNLTVWFSLSLALMVSCVCLFLYHSLKRSLYLEDEIILNDRLQAIVSILERRDHSIEALKRRVEAEWALRRFEKIYVRVTDADWNIITETPSTPAWIKRLGLRPEFVRAFFASRRSPVRVQESPTGTPLLVLAMEVKEPESHKSWIVYVAMDLEVEEKVLAHYQLQMLLTLLATFIASIFIGRFIARRGLTPVSAMATELSEIHSHDLDARISTDIPDELKILGETFNDLLSRIQGSMSRLSQFSADIAHEIRTPIHNLRGEIEVALSKCRTTEEYQEVLSSCLEECARLKSIVDSLLFLARAEQDATKLQRGNFILGEELANIAEFYEASAEDAGISLTVNVASVFRLDADRVLFQTAVGNILSNAIRYTPRGGRIEIFGRQENDSKVVIEIRDNGEGIAPEDLPFVFDRLYRADKQRAATGKEHFGLGLAIVKAIMKIHGGAVSISSQVGIGTSVLLEFPIAQITIS